MTRSLTRVLVEQRNHTRVLTLNRVEALNAVDDAMATALGDAFAEADDHPQTHVIVLTGAGRAFCAGMDLKAFAAGETSFSSTRPERGFAGIVEYLARKPVIAAVNGPALGLGAELVLYSDLAVADPGARFSLPEVRHGLFAAAGGAIRLPQQIPLKIAMEKLLTGDSLRADEAVEWGLINKVSAPGLVVECALELATRIADNSPNAVQETKRVAQAAAYRPSWDPDTWTRNHDVRRRVFGHTEAQEGVRAFAEKRSPVWPSDAHHRKD